MSTAGEETGFSINIKIRTEKGVPYCPTHNVPLQEDLEDSAKLDCPVCAYGFYETNPDIIWRET